MMNLNGRDIEISRGDTGAFTVTFTGNDKPEDGCIAEVSLKKTKTSDVHIWEKKITIENDQAFVLLIQPDTDLPFGQYWWDVRIIFRDGSVYTPMKPASFKILEVIGNGR